MLKLHRQQYLCVITYQYGERIVEIPSNPTTLPLALWLLAENGRLNGRSEHVVSARVFSEQDYHAHVVRRTAEFGLVAL